MSASSEKKRRQAERAQGIDKKVEAQRAADEQAKKSKLKWRAATVLIVVFVALCLLLNSSLPFGMTAVTVGSESLSAAEMNYYYANAYYNYYSYMSMFGVDSSTMYTEDCPFIEDGTWYDFLVQEAVSSATSLEALYQDAMANGFEPSAAVETAVEEAIAELPQYAESNGYDNVKDYLRALYGTGVTENVLRTMMTKGNIVNEYVAKQAATYTYSDSELADYYEEHITDFATYDYVYYFIAAETEEVTDEEGNTSTQIVEGGVEVAMETAEEMFAKITDEESFAAVVDEYFEGELLNTVTGYELSKINSAYRDWITDPARQYGDFTTASSSNTGAYIVMYVGMDDNMYPSTAMRHILVSSVDADGDGEYSEAEQAEAKAKVEEIQAEWLASDMTEDTFAAMAEQYSEDSGSNTNGGLYEGIGKGDMVTEINDFLFAEGRQAGDTAILHGNNGSYDGYHLVFFVGTGRDYHLELAENALVDEAYSQWETSVIEQYTATTGGMGFNLIGK